MSFGVNRILRWAFNRGWHGCTVRYCGVCARDKGQHGKKTQMRVGEEKSDVTGMLQRAIRNRRYVGRGRVTKSLEGREKNSDSVGKVML